VDNNRVVELVILILRVLFLLLLQEHGRSIHN
jgi:hypothetical protein